MKKRRIKRENEEEREEGEQEKKSPSKAVSPHFERAPLTDSNFTWISRSVHYQGGIFFSVGDLMIPSLQTDDLERQTRDSLNDPPTSHLAIGLSLPNSRSLPLSASRSRPREKKNPKAK